jgi:hypothetical protein
MSFVGSKKERNFAPLAWLRQDWAEAKLAHGGRLGVVFVSVGVQRCFCCIICVASRSGKER